MATKEEAKAVQRKLEEQFEGTDILGPIGITVETNNPESFAVGVGVLPPGTLPEELDGVKIIADPHLSRPVRAGG